MTEQRSTEFEEFASTQMPLVLHVATLLTGSRPVAEELAVDAMRRVRSAASSADTSGWQRRALREILRGWRRRRQPALERARGPLELHDLRPESATAGIAAPSTDSVIADALRALTDGERSVLVLHVAAGLTLDDVRAVVRRPRALVRRDLAASLAFLADASGTPSSRIEAKTAQALQMRPRVQSEADALVARLMAELAADGKAGRRLRPGLVAGAAVATAAVVAAAFLVGRAGDSRDVAADAADEGGQDSTSLELPGTASGLKLVGFQRIMVTVPEAWEQTTPLCINVATDTVLYPMDNELPPCVEAVAPGNSVAFGRYDAIESGVTFKRGRYEVAGEPLLLSRVISGGGEFLQYAALKASNVAVSVRSTDRAGLAAVLSSIQEVPAAYVVVPSLLRLEPDKASDLLADNALNGKVFSDSSAAGSGLTMQVVTQSPPVGTLLPLDATVNIGVLPD